MRGHQHEQTGKGGALEGGIYSACIIFFDVGGINSALQGASMNEPAKEVSQGALA